MLAVPSLFAVRIQLLTAFFAHNGQCILCFLQNGSTPLDCAKDQAVQDLFTQYAPKSGSTTSSCKILLYSDTYILGWPWR